MHPIVKRILIYLHLNLIGVWKALQETLFDCHRNLPRDLPSGEGKTLVITGGNRGIGYEAVKILLSYGFHVILGVRKPSALIEKLDKISKPKGSYEVFELDLTSFQSVKDFANTILAKNVPIHVLLNNAGVMFGPRRETEQGHELQMTTNHLSHFLLTSMLLPKLKEAGEADHYARVVNVSSAAHLAASWMDWSDFQSKAFYSPEGAYCNSKAAQIMTSIYMSEKCAKMGDYHVTFNALHPGIVRTDLYQHAMHIKYIGALFMRSPRQGADTLVHAVLAPELEGRGGLYLENSQIRTPHSFCLNLENQVKLWQKSCELCEVNPL